MNYLRPFSFPRGIPSIANHVAAKEASISTVCTSAGVREFRYSDVTYVTTRSNTKLHALCIVLSLIPKSMYVVWECGQVTLVATLYRRRGEEGVGVRSGSKSSVHHPHIVVVKGEEATLMDRLEVWGLTSTVAI